MTRQDYVAILDREGMNARHKAALMAQVDADTDNARAFVAMLGRRQQNPPAKSACCGGQRVRYGDVFLCVSCGQVTR